MIERYVACAFGASRVLLSASVDIQRQHTGKKSDLPSFFANRWKIIWLFRQQKSRHRKNKPYLAIRLYSPTFVLAFSFVLKLVYRNRGRKQR